MTCPHCWRTELQVKIGINESGSQRYLCKVCKHKYTPKPNRAGHSATTRQPAVNPYVDGLNFRRIPRHLKVAPQSVANWVNAHGAQLPETPPRPAAPYTVHELDELFTFIRQK